jgi:hypothetical protein
MSTPFDYFVRWYEISSPPFRETRAGEDHHADQGAVA